MALDYLSPLYKRDNYKTAQIESTPSDKLVDMALYSVKVLSGAMKLKNSADRYFGLIKIFKLLVETSYEYDKINH